MTAAGLFSTDAACAAGSATDFDSDFLFVTDAFNCTGACLVAALDAGFTLDRAAGLEAVLAPAISFFFVAAFGKALAVFVAAPLRGFAANGLASTLPPSLFVFGPTDLAGWAADSVASCCAFFAAGVKIFAAFFIACAI